MTEGEVHFAQTRDNGTGYYRPTNAEKAASGKSPKAANRQDSELLHFFGLFGALQLKRNALKQFGIFEEKSFANLQYTLIKARLNQA